MEGDFIKSKRKKSLNNNRNDIYNVNIWEQNIGTTPVNIPSAINNKNKILIAEHDVLYTDNRAIFLNETIKRKRKADKNKKIKLFKYIPDKTEELLTKVYDKINFMKNESKEIQKTNCLSLQKTSKCYFQTNRPKTSKLSFELYHSPINKTNKSNFLKTYSKKQSNRYISLLSFNKSEDKKYFDNQLLSSRNLELNLNTNENTKEETNSNRNSFKKSRKPASAWNKKKKLNSSNIQNKSKFAKSTTMKKSFFPIDLFENKGEEKFRNLIGVDVEKLYSTNKRNKLNLARINEIYRVQMNKSLKNYNPELHLKELNKIQLNDIIVRKEMEKVKEKMNKKINDRCQGQYFKKEYLRFKEEFENNRKWKSLEKKPFPILIPYNIHFIDDEKHKNVKVNPYGYKIRAYYDYCASCERIQKSKNKDLMEFGADLLFGHIQDKDHELLYDSLDELFNALEISPIMKYIDEMKDEKVDRDKNVLNERIRKYFPVFVETEKILQQMEKRKITKEKKFDENVNILDKIHEMKRLIKIHENEQNSQKSRLSLV